MRKKKSLAPEPDSSPLRTIPKEEIPRPEEKGGQIEPLKTSKIISKCPDPISTIRGSGIPLSELTPHKKNQTIDELRLIKGDKLLERWPSYDPTQIIDFVQDEILSMIDYTTGDPWTPKGGGLTKGYLNWISTRPPDMQRRLFSDLRFREADIEKFEKKPDFKEESHHKPAPIKPIQKSEGKPIQNNPYVFKKAGPGWEMIFDGGRMEGLKGLGFAYMHYLIKNDHRSFSALELYRAVNKEKERITLKSLPVEAGEDEPGDEENNLRGFQITSEVPNKAEDPKADEATVKSIQKSLQDINILLEEAQDNHDIQRISALKRKRDELMGEFGKYQWKSKSKVVKKIFPNDETRVSGSISRDISRALEGLRKHDELAYEHFFHSFKPISRFPKKYKPAQKILWILS